MQPNIYPSRQAFAGYHANYGMMPYAGRTTEVQIKPHHHNYTFLIIILVLAVIITVIFFSFGNIGKFGSNAGEDVPPPLPEFGEEQPSTGSASSDAPPALPDVGFD